MKLLTLFARSLPVMLAICAVARGQELGPPPVWVDDGSENVVSHPRKQSLVVNPANRAEVANLFKTTYMASQFVPSGWNGNRNTCTAGTNSQAYADATVLRINYYRAMAGLSSDITLSNIWNGECQDAALMMSAQGALSHSPPTNWACYSALGAEAAGRSDIALGADGPAAIDLYIDDPGANNTAAGHRRWIFYPPTKVMGTGSIPKTATGTWAANALWIADASGGRPAQPAWVAWPPQGYIPYGVLPKSSQRWSFSYRGANFTNTSVFMQRAGTNVPLALEAQAQVYADNTIVWIPQGVPTTAPASDITYGVTVSNVMVGGISRVFNYTVTIIDPYLNIAADPVLTARVATNNVILNWPSAINGYTLQRTQSPDDPASWQNVVATPQVISNQFSVMLYASAFQEFYRLKK